VPSAHRAARALLLRSTSALFLRDAHAPVGVQIAICESERMSTCLTRPRQLACARQRVADRTELSCVVGRSRRSEVLDLARVGDHMRSFVLYHPQTKCSLYRYSLQRRQHSSEVCVRRVPTGARRLTVKKSCA